MMRTALPALSALALATLAASAAACPFDPWMSYGNSVVLRNVASGAYVFATLQTKVDADGAPNAYHPDDVGLHCIKDSGFKGLDCPANAGYPGSDWWPSVLVADPKNPQMPYVQPPSSEFAGFFVSQTALQDKAKRATDPSKYVDSRTVPYLVFPGSFYKLKGTGDMGDIGYAVNIQNGQGSAFIVAETGPAAAKLGEISIALAAALGGTNPNPRTGSGTPVGKILFFVFPRSRGIPPWPVPNEHIAQKAETLIAALGGPQVLLSCSNAL